MRSRRQFLGMVGAGLASARGTFAIAADGGESFEFPVLGDLHFDRREHHDFEWLRANHTGDIRQIENYCAVTTEWSGKLLGVARQSVQGATFEVPFVMQLGDLVEGLAGSRDRALRQAQDAISWVQQADLGKPLAFCKGNHDVTGPGALETYDQTFVPWLGRQLGEADGAAFARQQGGTLIVFYDAYARSSLNWFAKLMEEKKPKQLIFVVHQPVVPYNARSAWIMYANAPAERAQLLELLGKYRATVLCGHLHKYSCVSRRTSTGKFVQIAISSVATDPKAAPKDERSGLAAFNGDLVNLEPNHSPETSDARRKLLDSESEFITHYDYADTWGHARLQVGREGVIAQVSRGLGLDVWREIRCSELVA